MLNITKSITVPVELLAEWCEKCSGNHLEKFSDENYLRRNIVGKTSETPLAPLKIFQRTSRMTVITYLKDFFAKLLEEATQKLLREYPAELPELF